MMPTNVVRNTASTASRSMIVEVMNSLQRLPWLHQRFGAGTVPGAAYGGKIGDFAGGYCTGRFNCSGCFDMFAAMRLASSFPDLP